jgi:hypothetical protein
MASRLRLYMLSNARRLLILLIAAFVILLYIFWPAQMPRDVSAVIVSRPPMSGEEAGLVILQGDDAVAFLTATFQLTSESRFGLAGHAIGPSISIAVVNRRDVISDRILVVPGWSVNDSLKVCNALWERAASAGSMLEEDQFQARFGNKKGDAIPPLRIRYFSSSSQ